MGIKGMKKKAYSIKRKQRRLDVPKKKKLKAFLALDLCAFA